MSTQILCTSHPTVPVNRAIGRSGAGRARPVSATDPSIGALFYHCYEVVPATTDELKLEAYKLRYQVYCLETGFEATEDCRFMLDAMGRRVYFEADEFDSRSVHYLIRHKSSQIYVATTRLILPNSQDLDAPFPIEMHCELREKIIHRDIRKQLGETSRFAVSRDLKRRLEGTNSSHVPGKTSLGNENLEHMTQRYLSMGLIACLIQATRRYGIHHCYAVMEQALLRMLHRYGIHFAPIGPATEYHGLRVPCLINVNEMVASIERTHHHIWELITNRGEFA